MRYLYGHPTARPITIGPGDFDPPDDYGGIADEPTEDVYRVSWVGVRAGRVCITRTLVRVDRETHAVVEYRRKFTARVVYEHGGRAYGGGHCFRVAADWCRRQAKKRGAMPRVWARLVDMAAEHGQELQC